MATKKNPLSALLSSDERKQAEEFGRAHVTSSSVRQAGTYGVGVRQPIPISQTSLGRLSNSLGTVSGILNQFSQYQSNKEKAELQGEGLQHQLNMQEIQSEESNLNLKSAQIQGGILDEDVKQQIIQLDQAEQQVVDAEFDYMLSQSNDEQRALMDEKAREQVRIAENAKNAAAVGIELRNPYEHTESPLYGIRALRVLGGVHAQEYAEYHAAEAKKKLDGLRDHPNGTRLSREEAEELAQETMRDFMKMKELDPNGEVGKGFMQATARLRAAKNPELANQLLEESEMLNTQTVLSNMKNTADTGGPIEDNEWFAQLSGMSQDKALALIRGSQGDPTRGRPPSMGLMRTMTSTHEGAVKFQMLFDQMAEKLQMGGKPFKEYSGFDTLQAQVEEAVENSAIEEVQKAENAYNVNWQLALNEIHALAGGWSEDKRAMSASNLIVAGETSDQLRAKLKHRFPSLVERINQVEDNMLVTFGSALVTTIKTQGSAIDATTNSLLAAAGRLVSRSDDPKGLAKTLMVLKAGFNADAGVKTAPVSKAIESYLSGQNLVGGLGLTKEGGKYLVGELNKSTGGLIGDYTASLNNLPDQIHAMLPKDATAADFNKAYGEGVDEIQTKLEDGLRSYFVGLHADNTRFIEALTADATASGAAVQKLHEEDEERGLDEAMLLDREYLAQLMKDQPHLTAEKAMKIAKERNKVSGKPSAVILSNAYGNNSTDAGKVLDTYERTHAARKKHADQYTQVGGEFYEGIQRMSTLLATEGEPLIFTSVLNSYKKGMAAAGEAEAKRLEVLVDSKEIAELAGGAAIQGLKPNTPKKVLGRGRNPRKPEEQRIVVKLGDEFLRLKERGYRRPKRNSRDIRSGEGARTPGDYLDRDAEGEPIIDPDWASRVREDVTLRMSFFVEKQTPIKDIPFGDSPPKTQDDLKDIQEALGWSDEDLKYVHDLYGFDHWLPFFQSQFNNSYYSNQRLSGADPAPVAAPTSPAVPEPGSSTIGWTKEAHRAGDEEGPNTTLGTRGGTQARESAFRVTQGYATPPKDPVIPPSTPVDLPPSPDVEVGEVSAEVKREDPEAPVVATRKFKGWVDGKAVYESTDTSGPPAVYESTDTSGPPVEPPESSLKAPVTPPVAPRVNPSTPRPVAPGPDRVPTVDASVSSQPLSTDSEPPDASPVFATLPVEEKVRKLKINSNPHYAGAVKALREVAKGADRAIAPEERSVELVAPVSVFDVKPDNAAVYAKENLRHALTKAASKYLGQQEGTKKNPNAQLEPIFRALHKRAGTSAAQDKSPWCAAFVSQTIKDAGVKLPFYVSARKYLAVGTKVAEGQEQEGDIAVMWNNEESTGGPSGWGGHAAFIIKQTEKSVFVISGNDQDGVRINEFDRKRLLGVRRLKTN